MKGHYQKVIKSSLIISLLTVSLILFACSEGVDGKDGIAGIPGLPGLPGNAGDPGAPGGDRFLRSISAREPPRGYRGRRAAAGGRRARAQVRAGHL